MDQNFSEVHDQVYYPWPSDTRTHRDQYLKFTRGENYGYTNKPFFFELATQAVQRFDTARETCSPEAVLWTPVSNSHLVVELPPGSVIRDGFEYDPVMIEGNEPMYLLYQPIRPCSTYALHRIYYGKQEGEDQPVTKVTARTYWQLAQEFFDTYDLAPVPNNNYAYGYTLEAFDYIVSRSGVLGGVVGAEYFRLREQALLPYYSLYLMAGAFGLFVDEPCRVVLKRNEFVNPLHKLAQRPVANIRYPL